MAQQVPGLTAEWSQHQLDLLELVAETVAAAPYEPSPPVCRECPCVRGRACVLDPVAAHGNETVTKGDTA